MLRNTSRFFSAPRIRFNQARRIAGDCCFRSYVLRHDGAGADDCLLPDGDAAHDRGIAADACAASYTRWHNVPIPIGLQRAALSRRTWVLVVDESHGVADENFIFDLDSFANK